MVLLLVSDVYLILEVHVYLYICRGTVTKFVSYDLIHTCCKHPLQEEVANAERAIRLMGASLLQTCFGMHLLFQLSILEWLPCLKPFKLCFELSFVIELFFYLLCFYIYFSVSLLSISWVLYHYLLYLCQEFQ